MLIRKLKYGDITAVSDIMIDLWGKEIAIHAANEMDEMFFSNSLWPPQYFVAEIDGNVVGFAGFKKMWLMSNSYEIIWNNVKKEYQGQKIGKMLMLKIIENVKSLGGTLIFSMTKNPIPGLKRGFRKVDEFNGYFLMALELGPTEISAK